MTAQTYGRYRRGKGMPMPLRFSVTWLALVMAVVVVGLWVRW